MDWSPEPDVAAVELADLERERAAIAAAAAINRHLDHWKVPYQLAAINKHIQRLRKEVAA